MQIVRGFDPQNGFQMEEAQQINGQYYDTDHFGENQQLPPQNAELDQFFPAAEAPENDQNVFYGNFGPANDDFRMNFQLLFDASMEAPQQPQPRIEEVQEAPQLEEQVPMRNQLPPGEVVHAQLNPSNIAVELQGNRNVGAANTGCVFRSNNPVFYSVHTPTFPSEQDRAWYFNDIPINDINFDAIEEVNTVMAPEAQSDTETIALETPTSANVASFHIQTPREVKELRKRPMSNDLNYVTRLSDSESDETDLSDGVSSINDSAEGQGNELNTEYVPMEGGDEARVRLMLAESQPVEVPMMAAPVAGPSNPAAIADIPVRSRGLRAAAKKRRKKRLTHRKSRNRPRNRSTTPEHSRDFFSFDVFRMRLYDKICGSDNYFKLGNGIFAPKSFCSDAQLRYHTCLAGVTEKSNDDMKSANPSKRKKMDSLGDVNMTDVLPIVLSDKIKNDMAGNEALYMARVATVLMDMGKCRRFVESGEFPSLIHFFRQTRDGVHLLFLVVIARLTLCYRGSQLRELHYLRHELIGLVFSILQKPKRYYRDLYKTGILNGNDDIYAHFMATVVGLYTMPCYARGAHMSLKELDQYEKHIPSYVIHFRESFSENYRGQPRWLPDVIEDCYQQVSMHDLAIDLLIDLDFHGIWDRHSGGSFYLRWTVYLTKAFQNVNMCSYRGLVLHAIFHQFNKGRPLLQTPDEIIFYACKILMYVAKTVEAGEKAMALLTHSHLRVAIAAAQLLERIIFVDRTPQSLESQNDEDNQKLHSTIELIRKTGVIGKLVKFIITLSSYEICTNIIQYRELYLHAINIVDFLKFDMAEFIPAMLAIVCTDEVPMEHRGPVALVIANHVEAHRINITLELSNKLINIIQRYCFYCPRGESYIAKTHKLRVMSFISVINYIGNITNIRGLVKSQFSSNPELINDSQEPTEEEVEAYKSIFQSRPLYDVVTSQMSKDDVDYYEALELLQQS